MLQDYTEEELADAIHRGTEEERVAAFGELYERHYPVIYRAFLRMLGHREGAEDATSEALIHVYEELQEGRFRGGFFGAWLMTVTRNALRDLLRKQHTHKRGDGRVASLEARTDMLGNAADHPDPFPFGKPELSYLEKHFREQFWDAVWQVIDTLPESQRQVWVLSEEEGLPDKEIAKLLGITIYKVKNILKATRKRLRNELARREITPETVAELIRERQRCGEVIS